MSRRRKVVVGVCLAVVVVVGAGLWALPEVVRRVAVRKIPELTGRATSIEDVDLNLFTGSFAVKKLRMARRPGHGPEAFVEFDRLDGRVSLFALLRSDVRLVDLRLTHPAIRITRTGPLGFDFSDLLQLFVAPVGKEEPSRFTFSLGRLEVTGGLVVLDDVAVAPPQQWRLEDFAVEAGALTTRPGQPPGRLRVSGQLGGAKLAIASESVRLAPVEVSLDLSVTGFDLVRLRPYLPPDVPAAPDAGRIDLALRLDRVRTGAALAESSLSGELRLHELSLVQSGHAAPFMRANRLVVGIKRMDFLARDVALGAIEIDGLDARAARDERGDVDLLSAFAPRPAEVPGSAGAASAEATKAPGGDTTASPSAPATPGKAVKVTLEKLALRSGTVAFSDAAVSPGREWKIESLTVDAASLSSAADAPPGRLRVQGQVTARPGSASPASFAVDADAVKLAPPGMSGSVALSSFPLAAVEPYWPPSLPATAPEGSVGLSLKVDVEQGASGLSRAVASGRASVQGLSMRERGAAAPFLKLPKLAVELKQADAVARQFVVGAVEVSGIDVRAARDAEGRIDLMRLLGEPGAAAGGSPSVAASAPAGRALQPAGPAASVTVERLTVRSGAIGFADAAVSPASEWRIDGLTVDGARLATAVRSRPGTLRLRAQVAARPGPAAPATVAVEVDSLRLTPLSATARVSVEGFALGSVQAYWPADVHAVATGGVLGVTASVGVAQDNGALSRAVASGEVRIESLALLERGYSTPFLEVPRIAVGLRQADALSRTIALGTVDVDGASLRAVRDAAGKIDLLGLAPAAEPVVEHVKAATGLGVETPAATPPPPGQWRISLERFAFGKGTLTFEDRLVSPAATLILGDVLIDAQQVSWPLATPATFSLSLGMPGGGRTTGKGTAVLEPLNVQIELSTRESWIEPFQTYFPFAAELRGRFSGDSLSEIQRGPKGELILASRGTAWASNLDVRAPGAEDPVVKLDAMAINDIDFSWPNYALVRRVILTHPQIRVERDADGAINLRALFAPRKEGDTEPVPQAEKAAEQPAPRAADAKAGTPPVPPAADAKEGAPPVPPADGEKAGAPPSPGGGGPLQTMVIDFAELEVENGFGRFVDHTTKPPFSEDISRLALTIKNLSNVLGRPERTTMTAQALVGVDGALDMRGDLSGIGESLRADLVAELRDFSLASANPYADSLTSWIVQRGTLEAKIHYHVEGDRITADHELEFKKLRVEKSAAADAATRKIGVPLGLAVALLKDSNGDIDFNLPLSGNLADRQFDWGEMIWAGVKQVIAKVLLSPFRAVGRLFKGSDDTVDKLEVDPITFAPGSAVIAPSTEAQLTRLADFLGRSPKIKLVLSSVLGTADVERLKEGEVRARLEALRREQQLPDLAAAVRAYYQQRVPGVALPKTTDEQIALLVAREPAPPAPLAELAHRRIDVTREDLVKVRGLAESRVVAPPPSASRPEAPPVSGEGRVEFTMAPAEE